MGVCNKARPNDRNKQGKPGNCRKPTGKGHQGRSLGFDAATEVEGKVVLTTQRIAIAGGGAIGLFIASVIKGATISTLCRPGIVEALQDGIEFSDLEGRQWCADPRALGLTSDAGVAFAGADFILVAVKSKDTRNMAYLIRDRAPKTAIIISLQNGLSNAAQLRETLPGFDVRAGVVAFNVTWAGARPALRRATSGPVVIEGAVPGLTFDKARGVELVFETNNIQTVQRAKLLLNLNNALNALSGLTLNEQLRDKGWRKLMAWQLREALNVFDAGNESIGKVGKADPRALRLALGLPGPLFRLALGQRLKIDAEARSSMQDDLNAGRLTEIGAFQGEILRRAQALGIKVPVTQAVIAAINAAENKGDAPRLRPGDVWPGSSR
jgi:2-dehydropantoate 2-reductase